MSWLLVAGHEDRVEFIVFDGLDFPPARGRCHGEMRLLDHAMEVSQTVKRSDPQCIVWKLTGRYKVLNLPAIIRRRPPQFDIYCDLRNNHNGPWCDMRVMAWTAAGYEAVLRGVSRHLNTENSLEAGETQLYHFLSPRLASCNAETSFWVEPYIDGARAFDNKNWNSGRQLLVYALRNAQRRLFGRPLI